MKKKSIQTESYFYDVHKLKSLRNNDPIPKTFICLIQKDVSICRDHPKEILDRRWGRPFLFCNQNVQAGRM